MADLYCLRIKVLVFLSTVHTPLRSQKILSIQPIWSVCVDFFTSSFAVKGEATQLCSCQHQNPKFSIRSPHTPSQFDRLLGLAAVALRFFASYQCLRIKTHPKYSSERVQHCFMWLYRFLIKCVFPVASIESQDSLSSVYPTGLLIQWYVFCEKKKIFLTCSSSSTQAMRADVHSPVENQWLIWNFLSQGSKLNAILVSLKYLPYIWII